MSKFIAIAGIRLEHDYYTPPQNSHLRLIPTPQTNELMKQRGVFFRQMTINEWQWLVDENNAGFMEDDILEVSIIVDDPEFLQKVSLKEDYDPCLLYQIRLDKENIVKFNPSPLPKETKHRGEFCRIVLKPIQDIEWLPIKPEQIYTIKFSTCSYYWEFLLVFKDKTDQTGQDEKYHYILETNVPNKPIVFHASKTYEDPILGKIYRIISEEKIEAKEHYKFTLTLYEYWFENNKRRVISKFIPIPRPGKYVASRPDILREVCYL